jgi:hypothetical protein
MPLTDIGLHEKALNKDKKHSKQNLVINCKAISRIVNNSSTSVRIMTFVRNN